MVWWIIIFRFSWSTPLWNFTNKSKDATPQVTFHSKIIPSIENLSFVFLPRILQFIFFQILRQQSWSYLPLLWTFLFVRLLDLCTGHHGLPSTRKRLKTAQCIFTLIQSRFSFSSTASPYQFGPLMYVSFNSVGLMRVLSWCWVLPYRSRYNPSMYPSHLWSPTKPMPLNLHSLHKLEEVVTLPSFRVNELCKPKFKLWIVILNCFRWIFKIVSEQGFSSFYWLCANSNANDFSTACCSKNSKGL